MAIKLHKAVTDAGGALGVELKSGDISTFLPTISKVDLFSGITTYRKLYAVNDSSAISIILGIEDGGEFDVIALFPSTGDAQVVGDLTGLETKYGASVIIKAIDSLANEETVNGVGGLTDIKKIVVPKHANYVLYRVGEFVNFAGAIAKISSVVDQSTAFEITLETAVTYRYTIGKFASTHIVQLIGTSSHESFWVEQYIQPGATTDANYNSIKMIIDY